MVLTKNVLHQTIVLVLVDGMVITVYQVIKISLVFYVTMTLDINECLQNTCEFQCTNTNGSYYCSCDTSSVLATDGVHCLGRFCVK